MVVQDCKDHLVDFEPCPISLFLQLANSPHSFPCDTIYADIIFILKEVSMFSIEFFSRIAGAIAGGITGGFLGNYVAELTGSDPVAFIVIVGMLGVLAGLIITPYITIRPMHYVRRRLIGMPSGRLVAILIGLFIGLIAGALLALPVSLLPDPFGQILPMVLASTLSYLSIVVLTARQHDLHTLVKNIRPEATSSQSSKTTDDLNYILLDTSVIIDGRVADVSKTGFLQGTLLIPNFVLLELQHIADSSDSIRRQRGRRGLEILSLMQNESPIPVQITDMDATEVREVDSKLVSLARHLHCPIMTNDYNLNRVAELQGVLVLNINDLANAIKVTYLPGEQLRVKMIQKGTEHDQGVGYLEDGTMVVVEGGGRQIGKRVNAIVTKVLQTSAGRMVFAK